MNSNIFTLNSINRIKSYKMTPEVGDMELEKMKYADLQKLAKVAGVKANMKVS